MASKYGGVSVNAGSKYGGVPVDPQDELHSHKSPPDEDMKEYIGSLLNYEVNWKKELPSEDRFMLGGAKPEEATQYIINKYPDKDVTSIKGRLMVRDKFGEGDWYPANKPGFTGGDVAGAVGAEGQSLLGGLLTAPVGGPVVAPVMGALGALGGFALREGGQSMGGYQKQSPRELVSEGFDRFAVDAGTGLAFTGAGKLIDVTRGAGFVPPHSVYRRDIANIANTDNTFMPHQLLPPGSAPGRISTQGAAFSKKAQDMYLDQALNAWQEMKRIKGGKSPYRLGIELERESRKVVERNAAKYVKPFKGAYPEATGFRTKEAFNSWNVKTKADLRKGYAKVRKIADDEKMAFNLSPAKEKFEELGVYGSKTEDVAVDLANADSRQLVDSIISGKAPSERVSSFINVAPTPQGKLNRVGFLLKQLDDEQASFEVIKQLRTQVGEVIENAPWDANINTASAKRLYGSLTDTLKNPKNATQGYIDAFETVNQKAVNRFSILEKSAVRKAIQTDDVISLGNKLGKPGGMTPEVRAVLSTEPEKLNAIALAGMKNTLTSDDGAKIAMQNWIDADPVGFEFLFGKKGKWMNDLAGEIDAFNSSELATTVRNNTKPLLYTKNLLLDEGMSRADVQKIVASYGGRGSKGHELLKFSMLSDIAEKSMVPGKKVGWTIDAKKFQAAVKPYRKNGSWNEILEAGDRVNLETMDSVARLLLAQGQDVGTTLEQAQSIAQLKHPGSFLKGVRSIGVGKAIAAVMMRPGVVRSITGSTTKTPLATSMLESSALIANSVTRSVIADPDIQEKLPDWAIPD